jgi:type I restriction enzyme, S subunit
MVAFPKYESYKDSSISWVREIPVTWKIERAKWLFQKMERSVRSEDDVVTAFRDGEVTLRKNRREEGFTNAIQEHGYQGIRKGDLVIHAMDAFAGAIGVSDSNGKSTPVYSVCIPRGEFYVNNFYYAYLIRYMAKSGFIQSLSKGIRERSTDFRFNDFSNLCLPIPSRGEQDRIVKFLDRKTAEIDQAIAQKQRLIELLQEQKAILINQVVTKGLNSNAPIRDSGIEWVGKIPEHWRHVRLKTLIKKLDQGWSPQCFAYPADINQWGVLKVGCVNGYQFNSTENKVLPPNLRPVKELEIQHEDILISRANTVDLVGSAACILRPRKKLMLCDKLYRVRVYKEKIIPEYFIFLLQTRIARKQIEIGANGASPSMQNIGQDVIKNLYTAIPPIDEQEEVLKIINNFSSQSQETELAMSREIKALLELKSSLISNSVTGKIKI